MSSINKAELISKLQTIEGLSFEERENLIGLLRSSKKYGLVWEEKPEDVEERLREELPVLREDKTKFIPSKNPEAPNHIIIEGDNLEALTALSYSHEGRIDVIYIDPPYNTGNKDFVYNDSFVDSEDEYRHSKWLSFMAKRLRIAKRLLSDRGVIFISIDDNEQANLKLLCDEVFLSSNCVAILPTIMNLKGNQDQFAFAGTHEYTIVYTKNIVNSEFYGLPVDEEEAELEWSIDDKGYFKQGAGLVSTGTNSPREHRPGLWFPIFVSDSGGIIVPEDDEIKNYFDASTRSFNDDYLYAYIEEQEKAGVGTAILPRVKGREARWRWGAPRIRKNRDEIIVKKGRDGYSLYKKQRPQLGDMPSVKPKSLFYKPEYSSGNGTRELESILHKERLFNNPKPLSLIEDIIRIGAPLYSTILDFFAGSGTTLHATMQLNAEDGGHRQCILVTNNENNICEEVTYERNKRIINGYTTPKGVEVEGLHDNKLRYYRTDFISRDKTQRNFRNLVAASTDLLCIKEDLYEEQTQFGRYRTKQELMRYFAKDNKRMLVVYREEIVFDLIDEIKTMDFGMGKLKVYVFAPDRYPFTDEFYEVRDKVEVVALPAAIIDAYEKVLPKRKAKLFELEIVEDAAQTKDLFNEQEEGEVQ